MITRVGEQYRDEYEVKVGVKIEIDGRDEERDEGNVGEKEQARERYLYRRSQDRPTKNIVRFMKEVESW